MVKVDIDWVNVFHTFGHCAFLHVPVAPENLASTPIGSQRDTKKKKEKTSQDSGRNILGKLIKWRTTVDEE